MRLTGSRSGYQIVEWNKGDDTQIGELTQRWPQLVLSRFVAIASCDSGPYKPGEEEFAVGWTQAGIRAEAATLIATLRLFTEANNAKFLGRGQVALQRLVG